MSQCRWNRRPQCIARTAGPVESGRSAMAFPRTPSSSAPRSTLWVRGKPARAKIHRQRSFREHRLRRRDRFRAARFSAQYHGQTHVQNVVDPVGFASIRSKYFRCRPPTDPAVYSLPRRLRCGRPIRRGRPDEAVVERRVEFCHASNGTHQIQASTRTCSEKSAAPEKDTPVRGTGGPKPWIPASPHGLRKRE